MCARVCVCVRPQVDFEGELAAVIGRPCRNVAPDAALSYVLGYTIANDVTARRWQKNAGGGQWDFGKSFDTFCPLGPFMVPANQVGVPPSLLICCCDVALIRASAHTFRARVAQVDPTNLSIVTKVNGEVMQDGNTSDMVFSVAQIISYLSQVGCGVPHSSPSWTVPTQLCRCGVASPRRA